MAKVVRELHDLRYLKWSYSRHSSGTAGSFLKSYEIIEGEKIYYKLSNYNSVEGIVGHECINEIVVARLLEKLGIYHLDYDLVHALISVDGKEYETYISKSFNFKKAGEGKIPFDIFFEMKKLSGETPIQMMDRFGWRSFLDTVFLIDFIILNRDRHGANIEVLKNREEESYRLAPIFDNGLSLLFNCKNDDEIASVDFLEDKKVQCYFGGNSTEQNLSMISDEYTISLPKMNDELKCFLFDGLEDIVSEIWIDAVFTMIKERCRYYESLRPIR